MEKQKKTAKSKAAKKGSGLDIDMEALHKAQMVMYEAWEAADPEQAFKLVEKALRLSKNCADAYNFMARYAESTEEALELYEQAVDTGRMGFDPDLFRDAVGHFWGIHETRPFMRAMSGLADCLWALDRRAEAIVTYREMLRLNPGDNQGMRYLLLSCLLQEKDWSEAQELIDRYRENTAAWLYSQLLLAVVKDADSPKNKALYKKARKSNPHIPAYLAGKRRMPCELPDYCGMGDETEAISYVHDFLPAWLTSPQALVWLSLAG